MRTGFEYLMSVVTCELRLWLDLDSHRRSLKSERMIDDHISSKPSFLRIPVVDVQDNFFRNRPGSVLDTTKRSKAMIEEKLDILKERMDQMLKRERFCGSKKRFLDDCERGEEKPSWIK